MKEMTILIADDEKRMRMLIKDFLIIKNFKIIEAADGQEAIDIFEEKKDQIDLILLDVMMPKVDGWTVLRKIRQVSKVPVIMLTARGEEEDELFGFELGVDEYITKPFSPKILVARIEAILKRINVEKEEKKDYGGIVIDESDVHPSNRAWIRPNIDTSSPLNVISSNGKNTLCFEFWLK